MSSEVLETYTMTSEEEIKEILEIFKKINEEYSVDTELDFEDYEIPNIYLKQFLDYITNLQTIEREYSAVLSENAELRIQISAREEEYINLQEEKEDYKSRNEKAIELIKDEGLYEEDTNTFCGEIYSSLPELLNILQGKEK